MTSENSKKRICVFHKLIEHKNGFNYSVTYDAHEAMHSHHSNSLLTVTRNWRPTVDVMEVCDILRDFFVFQGGAL